MNKKIKWHDSDLEEFGVTTTAFEEVGTKPPFVKVVGYNGILKGEDVLYEEKKYTVVTVFADGEFGLSETGELPFVLRVHPRNVKKA